MNDLCTNAIQHLTHLAVEIGCRPIGSPANLQAMEYIAAVFHQLGLTPAYQPFPAPDWQADSASLELAGEHLDAVANAFSPGCDRSAPMLAVGTLRELEQAEISGKMVIFYGELAQHELAAQGAIYVSPHDRRILDLLLAHPPAGIVTVNPRLHLHWRLIEDYDLDIPSVTVTPSVGLKLLCNLTQPLRMQISTRRKDSYSANVIAHLPGECSQRIVLCAHYDSKIDTPGAYDNAAGVACLLSLAERLATSPHRYTLEFIAFSGEEGYGLGDMVYAREIGASFDQVMAAVNFDGVAPRLAANTLAVFTASPAFSRMVDDLLSAYTGVLRVDPWPASDHYIFYSHGVPSLALTSLGIGDIYHTPYDTFDWISPEKLDEAIRLGLEIVAVLDRQEPGWTRATPQA